jgi:hypothetical protein
LPPVAASSSSSLRQLQRILTAMWAVALQFKEYAAQREPVRRI